MPKLVLNESISIDALKQHVRSTAKLSRVITVYNSGDIILLKNSTTSYHEKIDYTIQVECDKSLVIITAQKADGLSSFVKNLLEKQGYVAHGDTKMVYRKTLESLGEYDDLLEMYIQNIDRIVGREQSAVIEVDGKIVVTDEDVFRQAISEIINYCLDNTVVLHDVLTSTSHRKSLSQLALVVLDRFDLYLAGGVQVDEVASDAFNTLLSFLEELPEESVTEEPAEEVVNDTEEFPFLETQEYLKSLGYDVSRSGSKVYCSYPTDYPSEEEVGITITKTQVESYAGARANSTFSLISGELSELGYKHSDNYMRKTYTISDSDIRSVIEVVVEEQGQVLRYMSDKYVSINNPQEEPEVEEPVVVDDFSEMKSYSFNLYGEVDDLLEKGLVDADDLATRLSDACGLPLVREYELRYSISCTEAEAISAGKAMLDVIPGKSGIVVTDRSNYTDIYDSGLINNPISSVSTYDDEELEVDEEEIENKSHDIDLRPHSTEISAFKSLASEHGFKVVSGNWSDLKAERQYVVAGHTLQMTMLIYEDTLELRVEPDRVEFADEVEEVLSAIDRMMKGSDEFYFTTSADIDGMKKAFAKYKTIVNELDAVLEEGIIPEFDFEDEMEEFLDELEFSTKDIIATLGEAVEYDDITTVGDQIIATKHIGELVSQLSIDIDNTSVKMIVKFPDRLSKKDIDEILHPEYEMRSYGGVKLDEFGDLGEIQYMAVKHHSLSTIMSKSIDKIETKPSKSTSDIFDDNRLAEVEAKLHLVKDKDQKEQLKRLVKYVKQIAPWINENDDYNTFFLEEPKEFKKYQIPTVAIAVTCYLMDKSEWPGGEWDPGQVYKKFIKAKRVVRLRRWFKTVDPDGNKCWMAIFVDAQYAKENGRALLEESLNKVITHNGENFIVDKFENGRAVLINESRRVSIPEYDVLFR